MIRGSRAGALLLVGALWLPGCQTGPPPEPERVADPQRVIVIAPSLVELMYELDLGERLVGVGEHVRWPPEAAETPRIGGLFNPDIEQIARLEPQLAVLLPSEEQLQLQLDLLDIEVLVVPSESLTDIENGATALAERFGVPERGEAFVAAWREALAPRPLRGEPRVLLAVARGRGTLAETLSAGPDTFYHELLVKLGAVNVFDDALIRYPQVNLEEAMQRLPDAIIELQPKVENDYIARKLREDWNALHGVPALERGCYHILAGDYVMLPGPRVPQLYEELRQALERCGY